MCTRARAAAELSGARGILPAAETGRYRDAALESASPVYSGDSESRSAMRALSRRFAVNRGCFLLGGERVRR